MTPPTASADIHRVIMLFSSQGPISMVTPVVTLMLDAQDYRNTWNRRQRKAFRLAPRGTPCISRSGFVPIVLGGRKNRRLARLRGMADSLNQSADSDVRSVRP
jgi:hypothetical protein